MDELFKELWYMIFPGIIFWGLIIWGIVVFVANVKKDEPIAYGEFVEANIIQEEEQ